LRRIDLHGKAEGSDELVLRTDGEGTITLVGVFTYVDLEVAKLLSENPSLSSPWEVKSPRLEKRL
jgi:hypothetical protein